MHIGIASPILTSSLLPYLPLGTVPEPEGMGGTAVNHLILGLLHAGHSVSVYTLHEGLERTKTFEGRKLKIYFGCYRKSGKKRMMNFFSTESLQIKKFIEEDSPEIVHAHWSYEFAIGALLSSIPHLITLRDAPWRILYLKREFYRVIRLIMHQWVMRKGKNFVVNSPYLNEKLGCEFPVIPNSLPDHIFSAKSKKYPTGIFQIVTVLSGWSRIKNPDGAITAFRLLREKYGKKVLLHLIGNDLGENDVNPQRLLKQGDAEGIVFHGPVPHTALIQEFSKYDLLLHPSREESFGNTLLEAMANGIPVVAGENVGAIPWVIDDGRYGLLADVEQPTKLADACSFLIDDANRYELLSKKALAYVRDKFGNEYVTKQYVELYRKTLEDEGITHL